MKSTYDNLRRTWRDIFVEIKKGISRTAITAEEQELVSEYVANVPVQLYSLPKDPNNQAKIAKAWRYKYFCQLPKQLRVASILALAWVTTNFSGFV